MQALALGFNFGSIDYWVQLSFMSAISLPLEECHLAQLEELQMFKVTTALYLTSIDLSSRKLEVVILRCLPRLRVLELQCAAGVMPALQVLEVVDVGFAEDELCKLLEAHSDSLLKLQLWWHEIEHNISTSSSSSSSSSSGEDTEEGETDNEEEKEWQYPLLREYAARDDLKLTRKLIRSIGRCRHLQQLWLVDQRERSGLSLYDFLGLAHGCPELQLLRLDIPSLTSWPLATSSELLSVVDMDNFAVVNNLAKNAK